MLPWNKTHPGSKVTTVLELGTISDCRNHRRCGFWTHATDARNALTSSICPEDRLNAAVESFDTHIYLAEERLEFRNDLPCHCGQTVTGVGNNLRNGASGTAD